MMVTGCLLVALLVVLYYINVHHPGRSGDVLVAFAGALMALALACGCKCTFRESKYHHNY